MTDPRRLIDGGDAFESGEGLDEPTRALQSNLLHAARAYRPSDAGKNKTLAALGLGAAAGVGAIAAGSAELAKSAAGKGFGAWLLHTTAGKIVLSAVIFSALGGSALLLVHHPNAPALEGSGPASSAPAIASSAPPATIAPAPSEAASQPAPSASASSAPSTEASAVASAAPSVARPTSAPNASASAAGKPDLAGEAALLDRARARLAAGDASGALVALDEHRAQHPRAMLGIEATVLRIDALARSGDRARAKALGESFLAAHPDSPHAARVRSLIKDSP